MLWQPVDFIIKTILAFPREVTEETVKADTYGAQQSYCNLQSNIATNRSKNKDKRPSTMGNAKSHTLCLQGIMGLRIRWIGASMSS